MQPTFNSLPAKPSSPAEAEVQAKATEPPKTEVAGATSQLADAIKALTNTPRSDELLNVLEQQIASISPENLETVKRGLRAGIAAARAEVRDERNKMTELLAGTVSNLEASSAEKGEAPGGESSSLGGETGRAGTTAYAPDPLTGLPGRAYAEGELARALSGEEDSFLALFVVKRLALINAKFGYPRGDQVLMRVVAHLAQSLPEFNNLFRWAPCAFLNLAPPKTTYKDMRAKLQLVELTRLAPTLEWQGRSAMVPVALDCRILSVKDFGTPSELFSRLDTLATDA